MIQCFDAPILLSSHGLAVSCSCASALRYSRTHALTQSRDFGLSPSEHCLSRTLKLSATTLQRFGALVQPRSCGTALRRYQDVTLPRCYDPALLRSSTPLLSCSRALTLSRFPTFRLLCSLALPIPSSRALAHFRTHALANHAVQLPLITLHRFQTRLLAHSRAPVLLRFRAPVLFRSQAPVLYNFRASALQR